MTRLDRAKIFAPFDAMKGLSEALREREERLTRTERREICDEAVEHNSSVLRTLKRGTEVEIFCYSGFHDVVKRGKITYIVPEFGYLELEHEPIEFEDIYEISVCEESRPCRRGEHTSVST